MKGLMQKKKKLKLCQNYKHLKSNVFFNSTKFMNITVFRYYFVFMRQINVYSFLLFGGAKIM